MAERVIMVAVLRMMVVMMVVMAMVVLENSHPICSLLQSPRVLTFSPG